MRSLFPSYLAALSLLLLFCSCSSGSSESDRQSSPNAGDMSGDIQTADFGVPSDVGVERDDGGPPSSCQVCVPGCDGEPAIPSDEPFVVTDERGELPTAFQLKQRAVDRKTIVTRALGPPASASPSGRFSTIMLPEHAEYLELKFAVGTFRVPQPGSHLTISLLVNGHSVDLDVTDRGPDGEEVVSEAIAPSVHVPVSDRTHFVDAKIPAEAFVMGGHNTLYMDVKLYDDRTGLVRVTFKDTVYAGGTDRNFVPCVKDYGVRDFEPRHEPFVNRFNRIQFYVEGRIDTYEELVEGLVVEKGETVDISFFARPGGFPVDVPTMPSAVALFSNGEKIAGPFTFLQRKPSNLPNGDRYVLLEQTIPVTFDEVGFFELAANAWWRPGEPEFKPDGLSLGGIGSPEPDALGSGSAADYGTGILQVSVVEPE